MLPLLVPKSLLQEFEPAIKAGAARAAGAKAALLVAVEADQGRNKDEDTCNTCDAESDKAHDAEYLSLALSDCMSDKDDSACCNSCEGVAQEAVEPEVTLVNTGLFANAEQRVDCKAEHLENFDASNHDEEIADHLPRVLHSVNIGDLASGDETSYSQENRKEAGDKCDRHLVGVCTEDGTNEWDTNAPTFFSKASDCCEDRHPAEENGERDTDSIETGDELVVSLNLRHLNRFDYGCCHSKLFSFS